jgi:hypothetical protein
MASRQTRTKEALVRLQSEIDLFLPGETLQRSPSLWERVRGAFGGKLDLSTDRAKLAMEATAVVTQVRTALTRLEINNAVSLVIDDTVLFTDTEGRPDDLGDLMLALSEHASLFGQGFKSIRFAVEHEIAGLHVLVETQCLGEHGKSEAAAKIRMGGRIVDLEPKSGETADAYRARVTPIAQDPALIEGYKRQYEAFVAKLADAIRASFPEGRVAEHDPQAKVVRPQAEAPAGAPLQPGHPAYDPYAYYYPSPLEGVLSTLLIASFLSSALWSPAIVVVHPSGALIGGANDLESHTSELGADAKDPGLLLSGDDEDDDDDGDDDDADDDADDDGGDYDGGDYGGGDFD